jgi:phosphate uptake regulator
MAGVQENMNIRFEEIPYKGTVDDMRKAFERNLEIIQSAFDEVERGYVDRLKKMEREVRQLQNDVNHLEGKVR